MKTKSKPPMAQEEFTEKIMSSTRLLLLVSKAKLTPKELHIGAHGLQWNEQEEGNSSALHWTLSLSTPGIGHRNVIDHNIVSERFSSIEVAVVPKFYAGTFSGPYDKSEEFKTAMRRLSTECLEPINQYRAARAAGNDELMRELARLCPVVI
ncbi:hypothetical protein RB195_013945 [Necator americanus]|uniref:Uncharacterized protein n=1 Tax=Necator americanus TaxID=51031 RepID=A0ABR1E0M6_NECAM